MEPIVSRTLSVHKEHELLLKFEAAGLDDALAQRVIDSKGNDLAMKVVRLIRNGDFEPTTSHKQAHAIMGSNFFGVEEAIQHFGANPSREQLTALAEMPFSEEVLEAHKDTHILAAVFPMSILDIRGRVERELFYSHKDVWYNKEKFAKDKGQLDWQMVCKTPVPGSTNQTWGEQQALLAPDEQTPTARVMAYTIIGHFKATGERLFKDVYVRCSDLDSHGNRVALGYFDQNGLGVYCWDDDRVSYVGLASVRKFQTDL